MTIEEKLVAVEKRIRLLEENLQKAVNLAGIQQYTIDKMAASNATFQTETADTVTEFLEALKRVDGAVPRVREELAGLVAIAVSNFEKVAVATETLFKQHHEQIKSLGLEVGALRFSRAIDEQANNTQEN